MAEVGIGVAENIATWAGASCTVRARGVGQVMRSSGIEAQRGVGIS